MFHDDSWPDDMDEDEIAYLQSPECKFFDAVNRFFQAHVRRRFRFSPGDRLVDDCTLVIDGEFVFLSYHDKVAVSFKALQMLAVEYELHWLEALELLKRVANEVVDTHYFKERDRQKNKALAWLKTAQLASTL